MFSLIKGLFIKKELTDEELIAKWNNSDKKLKDFEHNIMKIKTNPESIVLQEISNIKLENFTDIANLIDIFEKVSFCTTINMSSKKQKKKVYFIYQQIKMINYIYNNIVKNERLIYFLFSSKYELFTFLLKLLNEENTQKEPLKKILYQKYFHKDIYLPIVEFFLSKDAKNEIEFLIPSNDNISILIKNKCIPIFVSLADIYLNYNEEEDCVNNAWINMIIYFNSHSKILFNTFSKYTPKKNFTKVETVLSLYNITQSIPDNNIELSAFANQKSLVSSFVNLYSIDNEENFAIITKSLLSIAKTQIDNYKNIKYLPLQILKYLIKNNAKIDYLTEYISLLQKSKIYSDNVVKNTIIKYLFENFAGNANRSFQLIKILDDISNNKKCFDFKNIIKEVNIFFDFLKCSESSILELCDLIKYSKLNDAKIKVKQFCDFLYNKSNSFKNNNNYDFIDQNYTSLCRMLKAINYKNKKNHTICSLLISFFEQYKQLRKYIISVLLHNKNLFVTKDEFSSLFRLFASCAREGALYDTLNNLIINYPQEIEQSIRIEMNKLLKFLDIFKVFNKYKIEDKILDRYTFSNYENSIDEIFEHFIVNTYNIEQIKSINEFIQNKNIQDIKNAMHYTKNELLFLLFQHFKRINRNNLSEQILHSLLEINDQKNLSKCLNIIYEKDFNKDNKKFKEFAEKNNLKMLLIENNDEFASILIDDINFDNTQIKFSIDKDNNDLFSIFSLIKKNDDVLKEKEYKQITNYNEMLKKFNQRENKNIKELIEIYYNNNTDANDSINYQYSLHPKLVGILNKEVYWKYIKDIKINITSKIRIYNFLLENKVIKMKNIVEYENISLAKEKNDIIENVIQNIKFFFNLFNANNKNDITAIIPNDFFEHNNFNKEQIIHKLIEFNLSHLKTLTFNNLQFLYHFLRFSLNEQNTEFLYLISSISSKLNLLPFMSNFITALYPNMKNIIERYYNDILFLNNNSKFFIKCYQDPQKKFICAEIVKNITMYNYINYTKIFSVVYPNINILLLFILKLTFSFFSLSAVMEHQRGYEMQNLLNLIVIFKLSIDDIKVLFEDILFFPNLTFILEASQNILFLDRKVEYTIKNYFNAKFELAKALFDMYNELEKNSILVNSYKIFQVKHCIIKNTSGSEVKDVYGKIMFIEDFSELYNETKKNEFLHNEIYNIYTNTANIH